MKKILVTVLILTSLILYAGEFKLGLGLGGAVEYLVDDVFETESGSSAGSIVGGGLLGLSLEYDWDTFGVFAEPMLSLSMLNVDGNSVVNVEKGFKLGAGAEIFNFLGLYPYFEFRHGYDKFWLGGGLELPIIFDLDGLYLNPAIYGGILVDTSFDSKRGYLGLNLNALFSLFGTEEFVGGVTSSTSEKEKRVSVKDMINALKRDLKFRLGILVSSEIKQVSVVEDDYIQLFDDQTKKYAAELEERGYVVLKGMKYNNGQFVFEKPIGIMLILSENMDEYVGKYIFISKKLIDREFENVKVRTGENICKHIAGEKSEYTFAVLTDGAELKYKVPHKEKAIISNFGNIEPPSQRQALSSKTSEVGTITNSSTFTTVSSTPSKTASTSAINLQTEKEDEISITFAPTFFRAKLGENTYISFNRLITSWEGKVSGDYKFDQRILGKREYDLPVVEYKVEVSIESKNKDLFNSEKKVIRYVVNEGEKKKITVENFLIVPSKKVKIIGKGQTYTVVATDNSTLVLNYVKDKGNNLKVRDVYENEVIMKIHEIDMADFTKAGVYTVPATLTYEDEYYKTTIQLKVLPDIKSVKLYKGENEWEGMESIEEASEKKKFYGISLKDKYGNVLPEDYIKDLELYSATSCGMKAVYNKGIVTVENTTKVGKYSCTFEGTLTVSKKAVQDYKEAELFVGNISIGANNVVFNITPLFESAMLENPISVDTRATELYEKEIELLRAEDKYGNKFIISKLSGSIASLGAKLTIEGTALKVTNITKKIKELKSFDVEVDQIEVDSAWMRNLNEYIVNNYAKRMPVNVSLKISPAEPYRATLKFNGKDFVELPTYV